MFWVVQKSYSDFVVHQLESFWSHLRILNSKELGFSAFELINCMLILTAIQQSHLRMIGEEIRKPAFQLPSTHSRCWEHLHEDEVLEIARKGEFWNFVTFPWRGNLRMKNVKLVQLKIQNMERFHWNRGCDLLTSFLSTLLIDSEFSSNKYKLNPSANAHNTERIFHTIKDGGTKATKIAYTDYID